MSFAGNPFLVGLNNRSRKEFFEDRGMNKSCICVLLCCANHLGDCCECESPVVRECEHMLSPNANHRLSPVACEGTG